MVIAERGSNPGTKYAVVPDAFKQENPSQADVAIDPKLRSDLIRKFGDWGLSGREIESAIAIETKGRLRVSPEEVKDFLYKGRKRGEVRMLTDEEKTDIQKTVANPFIYTDEVIDRDVRLILVGVKALEAARKPLPKNRLDLIRFRVPREALSANKKEGGVKIGHLIVFPDGTSMPTNKGLHHSPERNRRFSMMQVGRSLSEETIAQISVVYEKIGPLFFRLPQLSPKEWYDIAQFSDHPLSRTQIENAAKKRTKKAHALLEEFYSEENVAERKRRGYELVHYAKLRTPEGILKRENAKKEAEASQKMVAHFWEKGFFKWDLNTWNQIQKMYADFKRPLPLDPLHLLIAEVYLEGVKQAIRGDNELLREYKRIREELNPKLLSDTEQFVWAKFFARWADGEDNKGFFRLDSNGSKFRQLVYEDGEYVYENSKTVIGRMRNQDLVSSGRGK